ncbi:MAG TPA: vitamin K epoxide reductase [Chryseosolibacter sp.]|nr:vitamin K epoxide reductase [Chryseosolibacter sp.]
MWAQIVMTLLGIWMMVAPAVLGFPKYIADNARIVGPLVASFSLIAIWECTRNVRLFNLPLAVWLFAAPFVLGYGNDTALMNDYIIAILLILLCFVRPTRVHKFGGGWPSIWRDDSPHERIAGNYRITKRPD